LRNVADLSADCAEEGVVGDLEVADLSKVNAIKASKSGIRDEDGVGLGQTRREGELLKIIQSCPLDRINRGQFWESQSRQDCQACELQLSSNGGQVIGLKSRHVDSANGSQVAGNLFDTIERDSPKDLWRDLDGTREGLAGGCDGGGFGLIFDCGSLLTADGGGRLGYRRRDPLANRRRNAQR